MDINLDILSDDARAVAGGFFGIMGLKSKLNFEMRESRPTARTQAALDELVANGYALRRSGDDDQVPGAVEYRPVANCTAAFHWLRENESKGKWPITEPIGSQP